MPARSLKYYEQAIDALAKKVDEYNKILPDKLTLLENACLESEPIKKRIEEYLAALKNSFIDRAIMDMLIHDYKDRIEAYKKIKQDISDTLCQFISIIEALEGIFKLILCKLEKDINNPYRLKYEEFLKNFEFVCNEAQEKIKKLKAKVSSLDISINLSEDIIQKSHSELEIIFPLDNLVDLDISGTNYDYS